MLTRFLLQLSVKHCFIRGSVIRYVQLPVADVDTELLQVLGAFILSSDLVAEGRDGLRTQHDGRHSSRRRRSKTKLRVVLVAPGTLQIRRGGEVRMLA